MEKKLLAFILPLCVAFVVPGCVKDDPNAPREEVIQVHAAEDCSDEPLDAWCVDVKEGGAQLYVRTSVKDFKVSWQDAAPTPWLKVAACEVTDVQDIWKVTLQHEARSEDVVYSRRSGTLLVTKAENNLGIFFPIHQGAIERTYENFSDFKFGSWSPDDTQEEMGIEEWTDGLLNKGFASEPVAPATEPVCLAKNGYLKLGDAEGRKGALLTPVNGLHRYDSLLMVTFKAASYPGDDRFFKVEVLGGGVIKDFLKERKTSMTLETTDINVSSITQKGLWGPQTNFMIFIESTQESPVGVNTRLKITSGASGSGNARLYVDDFCVMKLVDSQDSDYFTMNQGSGQDRILAARNN